MCNINWKDSLITILFHKIMPDILLTNDDGYKSAGFFPLLVLKRGEHPRRRKGLTARDIRGGGAPIGVLKYGHDRHPYKHNCSA